MKKKIKIFGIYFIDISFKELSKKFNKGVTIMLPAAPNLINVYKDKYYRDALMKSDYNLFDSGYLCLLLRIFKRIKVKKFSGAKFMKKFLEFISKKNYKILLINPNLEHNKINAQLLKSSGIKKSYGYIAPIYKDKIIKDQKLLRFIRDIKPKFIMINIGGGIQEILATYIRENIKFKSTILCTGAAIAFMTGKQARVPNIVDKFYLGWLSRILFSPRLYFFRYLNSFKLKNLILKDKSKVMNK